METDEKHKLLYAIYAEYQKPVPDMTRITPDALRMEDDVFKIALVKLENEALISGLTVVNADQQQGLAPIRAFWNRVMPTRQGIEYVEGKLEIDRTSTSAEKIRWLVEKFGGFGWNVLQSVASRILTEMVSR